MTYRTRQQRDNLALEQIKDLQRQNPRPESQPITGSGIRDQQGGTGIRSGRTSPVGGPAVAERLGAHTDRQVKPSELPQTPTSPATVGGAAKPPRGR